MIFCVLTWMNMLDLRNAETVFPKQGVYIPEELNKGSKLHNLEQKFSIWTARLLTRSTHSWTAIKGDLQTGNQQICNRCKAYLLRPRHTSQTAPNAKEKSQKTRSTKQQFKHFVHLIHAVIFQGKPANFDLFSRKFQRLFNSEVGHLFSDDYWLQISWSVRACACVWERVCCVTSPSNKRKEMKKWLCFLQHPE